MLHLYDPPRTHEPPRDDGSVLSERIPFWSISRANGLIRVTHDVTHFTHPHDDACDAYGRALYVTLHEFVVMDTDRTFQETIAECPQFSLNRDRAPAEPEWPRAVRKHIRRLSRIGVQVFRRHFVCDDEDYELDMRRELPSRRMT